MVQREVSKPRIDCIDGCRFALVFPIVIAHFARLEPAGSLLVSLLPVPACQVWHQQSDRAEAAHAGERACRRLLCHLGVRHSPSITDLLILSRMVCAFSRAQVSAYTSTKLGERKAEDKKLANPELFFWQRAGPSAMGCGRG